MVNGHIVPEPSTVLLATILISLTLFIRVLRPARLQRSISFFALLAFLTFFTPTSPANAATIFESGTLGPVGLSQGSVTASNINAAVFAGVRFQLTETVFTSEIGGHFVDRNNGTFFGAIIALDDVNDFPDSGDLSTPDVLGSVELTFPNPSSEVFADLELTLEPGWYALAFGSGLFGTTGDGAAPLNNPDIGDPVFIAYQPGAGWGNLLNPLFRNFRFTVQWNSSTGTDNNLNLIHNHAHFIKVYKNMNGFTQPLLAIISRTVFNF